MLLYSEHTHVCFMKWQRHDCLLHRRPQICVALGQQVVLCVQKAERIGALTWRLVLLAPPQVTAAIACYPVRQIVCTVLGLLAASGIFLYLILLGLPSSNSPSLKFACVIIASMVWLLSCSNTLSLMCKVSHIVCHALLRVLPDMCNDAAPTAVQQPLVCS